MKTLGFVYAPSKQKDQSCNVRFSSFAQVFGQISTSTWLYFLSLAVTSIGIGIGANQAIAQVYYQRPVAATRAGGTVSTQSGIGLNIRSGPGLSYDIIGGADDGVYLDLSGSPTVADGYRWQRAVTGGWVATEYVAGNGFTPVSTAGNCYQPVSYYNGNCAGGSAEPVRPIIRPISSNAGGAYVVAVPGANSANLSQVRRIVPNAYFDRAREGSFINAGGYSSFDAANSLTYLLRNNNLDARVIYGR
ncbi:hypothetical protein JOY44_16710 [Phormidium sp. CLA17]|uniref:hypothetical protein n=1 Tax=Leptolyngbya sp. Cla-17 TaxID=2803751 RepID=UPI00149319DD|nr:hypothetical protein [Leptolyngbya sp. Cla-17]MBM0743232.1 hypothetical protein [Leptolyngbya sp. Cla-17]